MNRQLIKAGGIEVHYFLLRFKSEIIVLRQENALLRRGMLQLGNGNAELGGEIVIGDFIAGGGFGNRGDSLEIRLGFIDVSANLGRSLFLGRLDIVNCPVARMRDSSSVNRTIQFGILAFNLISHRPFIRYLVEQIDAAHDHQGQRDGCWLITKYKLRLSPGHTITSNGRFSFRFTPESEAFRVASTGSMEPKKLIGFDRSRKAGRL